MNSETVTVTIKGVPRYFKGDELTSAMQQAAEFLLKADEEDREF